MVETRLVAAGLAGNNGAVGAALMELAVAAAGGDAFSVFWQGLEEPLRGAVRKHLDLCWRAKALHIRRGEWGAALGTLRIYPGGAGERVCEEALDAGETEFARVSARGGGLEGEGGDGVGGEADYAVDLRLGLVAEFVSIPPHTLSVLAHPLSTRWAGTYASS